MWNYDQASGRLCRDNQFLVAGYSGHGDGKNSPQHEQDECIGPIPRGFYRIGSPFKSETHGPHVLRLFPDVGTNTWGRSGFLIHGDSIKNPGEASLGCIVIPLFARERISDSGDNKLHVV